MKQLFKTTLLATAVAVTCGTAFAGTVAVTKQVHSTEGLVGITADQTSNAISYTLAAAYREGDKITFTFPADSLATTSFASQINVAAVDSATPASAIAGLALGLLSSDATSVTYRVTSVTQPGDGATPPVLYTDRTTIGAVLDLGTVSYKAAAVSTGAITVTVSSETTVGDVLDNTGTRTATVAEAKTQFGTATVGTKFDAVVDVSSARMAFVGGASDSMAWTITNPTTTGWLNLATVNATNGTNVTVKGEAGKMTGLVVGNWASSGTRAFTEASASLAVSYNGATTNDTITFTPTTGDNAVVLESQSFTTDFAYNYTSAGSTAGVANVGTNVASGAWELNGAVVNIPYMPFSSNASQIIYVSNAGTQSAEILMTAFDDAGNTYNLGVIGRAFPQRVTKLSRNVSESLTAAGFTGGKLSITLTVNAPDDDITVYASYNAGSNRGFVNTDQYKGIE